MKPRVALPRRIHVGPFTYRVAKNIGAYARIVHPDDGTVYGEHDAPNAVITLEPTQGAAHTRLVLWHEVLHACWYMAMPSGSVWTEEEAIRILSGTSLEALRRNPRLVAYLLAKDT